MSSYVSNTMKTIVENILDLRNVTLSKILKQLALRKT